MDIPARQFHHSPNDGLASAVGHRLDALLGVAVFALALALRLIFLLAAGDKSWPHSTYFEGDAPLFAEWAAALDRGDSYSAGLPLHSPATAYLLHWFGPASNDAAGRAIPRDFTAVKFGWCIVSAMTTSLLFWVARPLGRRVALVASLLHATSFGTYVLATSLNNECLYGLAIVAVVGLTAHWMRRPTLWLALAIGVVHGVATLLRAEHPLLAAIMGGAMAISAGRGAWRLSALAVAALVGGLVGVCTPWLLKSHAAITDFNTRAPRPVDFTASRVEWSDDARALLESMPAFARLDNFQFISYSFLQKGRDAVNAADVRRFLLEQFRYIPEPISPWVLVSCQGPLAFALANHPDSGGGFSKAALDARFGPDPRLQFSLPSHLRLVNHGYAAGFEKIREDPAAWLRLAGRKLERFARGAGLGFTAMNWPLGREGPRPAVDILAPPVSASPAWSIAWAALLAGGVVVACRRRVGGLWLCVIVFKLIVTIAFFGYARQAASIAPAFFILAALAIDALLHRLDRRRGLRVAGWAAIAVFSALVVIHDVRAGTARAEMRILGSATVASQWGPGAFLAADTIELRLATPPGD